jgi:hypothetical protein
MYNLHYFKQQILGGKGLKKLELFQPILDLHSCTHFQLGMPESAGTHGRLPPSDECGMRG